MSGREVLVGWRRPPGDAALAFPAPRPLTEAKLGRAGEALGGELFAIPCPWDARIRYDARAPEDRRFQLVTEDSSLSRAAFRGFFLRFNRLSQRRPDVPTVQFTMKLNFVADEDCVLTLLPPFLSPSYRDWPGPLVAGRFPLTPWPRSINIAIEWEEPDRDWIMRRGEPLGLVRFQFADPDARPRLVEAENTEALVEHIARLDAVGMYGRDVRPMFAEARRRRPERLLVPKQVWGGE